MKRKRLLAVLLVLALGLCVFSSCGREEEMGNSTISGDEPPVEASEYLLPTKIMILKSGGTSVEYELLCDGDTFTIIFGNDPNAGSASAIHRAVREFDANGNLLSAISYKADGSLFGRVDHTYDADGRETKNVSTFADYQTEYAEYSNDAGGNRIKEIKYYEGGSVFLMTEYDVNGRRTWTTHYNDDGSVYCYSERVYDERGNVVKWSYYDSDEVVYWLQEYSYEYDRDGKPLKERQRVWAPGGEDEPVEYIYEYDANGQPTKRIAYDGDTPLNGSETLEYGTVPLTEAQYLRYCALIQKLFFLPSAA